MSDGMRDAAGGNLFGAQKGPGGNRPDAAGGEPSDTDVDGFIATLMGLQRWPTTSAEQISKRHVVREFLSRVRAAEAGSAAPSKTMAPERCIGCGHPPHMMSECSHLSPTRFGARCACIVGAAGAAPPEGPCKCPGCGSDCETCGHPQECLIDRLAQEGK